MRDNLQSVLHSDASGLGIRQFKRWQIDRTFDRPLASFDEIVELVDVEFSPEPLPTGELLLWLHWRPLRRSDRSLKTFVHITGVANSDSGAALWSQDDQFPQEGRLDSTSWPLQSVFRDVYYLSADAMPAGDYQLIAGWYEPVSGHRLTTSDNRDHYAIASFSFS